MGWIYHGIYLQSSSEAARRAAVLVCPQRAARITPSVSLDSSTASVKERHGGVSIIT